MTAEVERMLRKDQLSQNQAKYQQRGYEIMLHGYVGSDANYVWELKPSSVEKASTWAKGFPYRRQVAVAIDDCT